jgi:hypothetical protein
MERTSGRIKIIAAAATAALLAGPAAILYGIARDEQPSSTGGLGLTVIGLTILILIVIRKWVTDTLTERLALGAAQREAQTQRDRYVAAQAALENEQGRLRQDLNAEHLALAARLEVERAAIERDFEEQRAALIAETVEATFLMIHSGKCAPTRNGTGNLIQFPQQHPQHQAERTRSREHGVVGP